MNKLLTDEELEHKLMSLFSRCAEFGRVFLTSATKEEFAKSVNQGALDHQEAAHEAMKLIKQYGLQERIDENDNWLRHIGPAWDAEGVLAEDVHKRQAELKAKQENTHAA